MKSETSVYTSFEFEVDGFPAVAIINTEGKNLPDKSLYATAVFIMVVPDSHDEMGHPDEKEFEYLNTVEKELISYLENQTRSVHVGHTTLYRAREIIFYTADPELVTTYLEHFLSNIERESDFEMLSDPEWKNVSPFYDLL